MPTRTKSELTDGFYDPRYSVLTLEDLEELLADVIIFACEPCNFLQILPDTIPPQPTPVCPKCGTITKHSSPATAQAILRATEKR